MSADQPVSAAEVPKERSMLLQKEMIGGHYRNLANAPRDGRKVVYTFVPGNLTELMRSFDVLPVLPEINALQSGMRKLSGGYISEAEKQGHSEDVCTYVKCDIGMLKKGNVGPTGERLPEPDLLLLSYTGCFTFMKWFELLRQEYDCPVAMLHVPYQADGRIHDHHRDYVVEQLENEVIPKLEQVTGKRFDEDRLRQLVQRCREPAPGRVAQAAQLGPAVEHRRDQTVQRRAVRDHRAAEIEVLAAGHDRHAVVAQAAVDQDGVSRACAVAGDLHPLGHHADAGGGNEQAVGLAAFDHLGVPGHHRHLGT